MIPEPIRIQVLNSINRLSLLLNRITKVKRTSPHHEHHLCHRPAALDELLSEYVAAADILELFDGGRVCRLEFLGVNAPQLVVGVADEVMDIEACWVRWAACHHRVGFDGSV